MNMMAEFNLAFIKKANEQLIVRYTTPEVKAWGAEIKQPALCSTSLAG